MKKYIRIDMDYSSSPIWDSEDGLSFISLSISEVKMSDSLKSKLEFYRTYWEECASFFEESHFLFPAELLSAIALGSAQLFAQENPGCTVGIWNHTTDKMDYIN